MQSTAVPDWLQPMLWSSNIKHLNTVRDSAYIVHQLLAHGDIREFVWLFQTYSGARIAEVFTTYPYKDYTRPRYLFIKNYVLHLSKRVLNEQHYVKNTSRDIRYGQNQTL